MKNSELHFYPIVPYCIMVLGELVTIQYTAPDHCDIEGNEMFDFLAKQGARLLISLIENVPVPQTHC